MDDLTVDYAPHGPIESAPTGTYDPAVRRDVLADSLTGVPLGSHDKRIIDWILMWDDSTIRTVASLFYRTREAGEREGRAHRLLHTRAAVRDNSAGTVA